MTITELNADVIYTVSALTGEARALLETNLSTIWISGELSNLSRPASGHLYFSLKDERAQVRCAFFRNYQRSLNFTPENGQQILLRAQVSLYEPRGDFQLIVTRMEIAGAGALQIAFDKLKKKLEQEGLFSQENKKPLPVFPKKIGVVTSSSGAAIRDILQVLKRRFASIPVIIYPCSVQGDKAAGEIVTAIQTAQQRQECDVLIVARGGGSLEDLWPFNEEAVAHAIFACDIPVVSGVGHEVDFTIADFVADQRAPTPSAAAETVSPETQQYAQRLDQLEQRLITAQQNLMQHKQAGLKQLSTELNALKPQHKLQQLQQQAHHLQQRLLAAIKGLLQDKKQRVAHVSQTLQTISPLTTLERGYAIVTYGETIVRTASDVKPGDRVTTRLAQGQLSCIVESN